MSTTIKLRRGTAAAWTSADPTLAEGELGLEVDTAKLKIGDGLSPWTGLAYAGGVDLSADVVAALDGAASPSGENPFATMADVPAPSTPAPTMLLYASLDGQDRYQTAPIDMAAANGIFGAATLSAVVVRGPGAAVLASQVVVPELPAPAALTDITYRATITDLAGVNTAVVFALLSSFEAGDPFPGATFNLVWTGNQAPTIEGTDLSVVGGEIVTSAGGVFSVAITAWLVND